MSIAGYPIMKFDPENRGVFKVCEEPGDVPEGWVDNYEAIDAQAPGEALPPKESAMTKAELVAALEMGGVPFKKTDGVAALTATLTAALQAVLVKKEVTFDPNAGPRALLELVTA